MGTGRDGSGVTRKVLRNCVEKCDDLGLLIVVNIKQDVGMGNTYLGIRRGISKRGYVLGSLIPNMVMDQQYHVIDPIGHE